MEVEVRPMNNKILATLVLLVVACGIIWLGMPNVHFQFDENPNSAGASF